MNLLKEIESSPLHLTDSDDKIWSCRRYCRRRRALGWLTENHDSRSKNHRYTSLNMTLILTALAYFYAISSFSAAAAAQEASASQTADSQQTQSLSMPHLLSPAQLYALTQPSSSTTRTSARPVIVDEENNSNNLFFHDETHHSSNNAFNHPPVIHSNSMFPIFGVVPRLPLNVIPPKPSSIKNNAITNATASAELLLRMLANNKTARALKRQDSASSIARQTTTMPPVPIVMIGDSAETTSVVAGNVGIKISDDNGQSSSITAAITATTLPPATSATTEAAFTAPQQSFSSSLSDKISSRMPAEIRYETAGALPHTEAVQVDDLVEATTSAFVPPNNTQLLVANVQTLPPAYLLSSNNIQSLSQRTSSLSNVTTLNNKREAKAITDIFATDAVAQLPILQSATSTQHTTTSQLERQETPTRVFAALPAGRNDSLILNTGSGDNAIHSSTSSPPPPPQAAHTAQERMLTTVEQPSTANSSGNSQQSKAIFVLMNSNATTSSPQPTRLHNDDEHAALIQQTVSVNNNNNSLLLPSQSTQQLHTRSTKLGAGALAGIIVGSCVGGIILLALAALLVVFMWRKRRRTKSPGSSTGTPSGAGSSSSSASSAAAAAHAAQHAEHLQQHDPYGSALARHYYWANADDKALTTTIYNSGGRGSNAGYGASSSSGIMGYAQQLDKNSQRGSPVALTDFYNEMVFLDNDAFLDSLEDIGTTTLDRETLRRSIIDDDHKNTKV